MRRFSVMTLTGRAVARVKEIMQNNPDSAGIVIGVKKGGCAGMEYTVELAGDDISGMDKVEQDGACVLVSPDAVLFLLGTEMDYEATTLRTGFVFKNPNQTSACGCGESVEIRPVPAEALQGKK
ncbi:MAG: FeS assembly scaffold SufA [Candidatus Tokpelaia hoelldobleri]|uniref:FeS assembly scaffold SufA n=1 Tax=Candidatus Tokpelaia hoelldobleri TaxID=1902579 RepID=A0A1U9JUH4_9HYPH|nr:MAG: FeS assembly scaffold SufA [Candidatus Tokpelaia hoelldoblerii]